MAQYATESIRTVALVGHGAAGKTTLAEALLVRAKAIQAPGSVERGTTVSDYIWQARLQNCRQELEAHAGTTITDVAFSWGFSSSSHFSRVFRKYFGVVPSSIHKAQHGTSTS